MPKTQNQIIEPLVASNFDQLKSILLEWGVAIALPGVLCDEDVAAEVAREVRSVYTCIHGQDPVTVDTRQWFGMHPQKRRGMDHTNKDMLRSKCEMRMHMEPKLRALNALHPVTDPDDTIFGGGGVFWAKKPEDGSPPVHFQKTRGPQTDWAHLDHNVTCQTDLTTFQCYQCAVICTPDCSSVTVASPKSHVNIETLFKIGGGTYGSYWLTFDTELAFNLAKDTLERNGGHWQRALIRLETRKTDKGKVEQVPVPWPVGTVLVWDSRTIHSAIKACRTDAPDSIRCISYISSVPRSVISQDVYEQRVKCIQNNTTASHLGKALSPGINRYKPLKAFSRAVQETVTHPTQLFKDHPEFRPNMDAMQTVFPFLTNVDIDW